MTFHFCRDENSKTLRASEQAEKSIDRSVRRYSVTFSNLVVSPLKTFLSLSSFECIWLLCSSVKETCFAGLLPGWDCFTLKFWAWAFSANHTWKMPRPMVSKGLERVLAVRNSLSSKLSKTVLQSSTLVRTSWSTNSVSSSILIFFAPYWTHSSIVSKLHRKVIHF